MDCETDWFKRQYFGADTSFITVEREGKAKTSLATKKQKYQNRFMCNDRVKAARLEANRKNHEEMKNKLLKQHKERATFVAKYGVLKIGNDVENVMNTFKSNAAKTKALKTYILYETQWKTTG